MFSTVLSSFILIFVIVISCLALSYIVDYIRNAMLLKKLVKKGYLNKDITVKELADMKRVIIARDIEFYLEFRKNQSATNRPSSGVSK